MIPPVRMEPSVPFAVPSREALALLRILVVAGEGGSGGGLLQNLRQWADDGRLEIDTAPDLPRAVRQLSGQRWDVVLAVLGEHPDDDLSWWVDTLRGATGSPRLIAVAQAPSMGLVLRAEKSGVLDVLALPLRREELMRALERVRSVVSETAVPLPLVEPHAVGPYALVGQSAAMLDVYKLLARVAGSSATVLVQGESGTGKEVAARAIHMNGPHASGAFVAVNCAAIPENLLESELFGHEKGAFTGAVTRKIGRFEQAASGTLFLDEIADMSLALQAKILRAVQEREIERVGGSETIPVDVRLIAATNRDLKEAIKQGRFREDLYYRLAVVTIRLPTLVERGDDLVLLTAYYVRLLAQRYGKKIQAISDRALGLLRAHAWVGNVRELRTVIERPELEALARRRARRVSIARPDGAAVGSSSGPYLTLGTRGVHPDELRRRRPQAFQRITGHLQVLFKAYVEALECQQRADAPGVVAALVRAGRLEEEVGRHTQARTWYEVALRVAEALQDRRPEVEALRALGYVCLAMGEYAAGARHFQRSFALAESEFDQAGATAASEGLGDVALAQGQWGGAQAWYSRGLRLAEAAGDAPRAGRLERQLGVLARKQRDPAAAGEFLRRARERFAVAGPADEMASVLNEQGLLDAQLGRHTAASAAYREAVAWAQRAPRDARLELSIRLNLAELDLEAGRLLEAEAELRRAEQVAIGGHVIRRLAQIYTLMGRLRGAQGDETGFVFFEQAIELAKAVEHSVATEAQVYHAYGLFRSRLGQQDEARAYLERARELFDSLGEAVERERVDAELRALSA